MKRESLLRFLVLFSVLSMLVMGMAAVEKVQKALITCEFTCSNGSGWHLACGGGGSLEECCEIARTSGCPRGSTFSSGHCQNGEI